MNTQKENDVLMCNGQVRCEDIVFLIAIAYNSTVMDRNESYKTFELDIETKNRVKSEMI